MRSNKSLIVLVVIAAAVVFFFSGFLRSWLESQEKARLEGLLAPAISRVVGGIPDPKPSLWFVTVTDKSLVAVIRWERKPDATIKNGVREQVIDSIRRELAADPKSWGRHISVTFDDELVSQGFK